MGMTMWDWEGLGILKAIPVHLIVYIEASRLVHDVGPMSVIYMHSIIIIIIITKIVVRHLQILRTAVHYIVNKIKIKTTD